MRIFGFFCLWLCISLPLAGAQALPPTVHAALTAAQIPVSAVGVVVQPLDQRAPLVSHRAGQAMNPASVMKLLTTYAALDKLGPAYTWQTRVLGGAPSAEGVLAGDLVFVGGGDPRFLQEHLTMLLRQLRQRGVAHIRGNVLLDRSLFDVAAIDPAEFDDKPLRPYNVGPDALLLNFRALRFLLSPEGGSVRLWAQTPMAGILLANEIKAGAGTCGGDWKDAVSVRLVQGGGMPSLVFSGSFPLACGERVLNLAPLAADLQVESLLRALWQELGGTLDGKVMAGRGVGQAGVLAQHESAPLAEIVRDINKFSNNVMARQLFLSLSLPDEAGADTPASVVRSQRWLAAWLAGRGLDFPELVVENGSGLSRRERLSAHSLSRLLLDAWQSPVMAEFMSSLPVVGVDGTMKKRLADSPARGRGHIKTGTLEGVKTAAGYVQDRQGRRYAVVFLINHPHASAGQPAIDALLQWVVQH